MDPHTTNHAPVADPNYVHTVGWWQGVLGGLGRISTTACRMAPDAPVSLCGGSLLTDETTPAPSTDLPPCPQCALHGTQKGRS